MGSASGSKGERFMMNAAPTEEYRRYCFVKCLTAPHAYIICCSVVAMSGYECMYTFSKKLEWMERWIERDSTRAERIEVVWYVVYVVYVFSLLIDVNRS